MHLSGCLSADHDRAVIDALDGPAIEPGIAGQLGPRPRRPGRSHLGGSRLLSGTSAAPVLVVLLYEPLDALIVLIWIAIYQQIENYLLAPGLTAKTMDLAASLAFAAARSAGSCSPSSPCRLQA